MKAEIENKDFVKLEFKTIKDEILAGNYRSDLKQGSIVILRQIFRSLSKEPGKEEEKWISVEDRLPEKGELVLVFFDRNSEILFLNELEQFSDPYDDGVFYPTHWQPLPTPPKQ